MVADMESVAFPPELFDIVIAHLSEDRATSCACALVCRSWLHPARQNVFHTIHLKFRLWTAPAFLALLRGNPELGSYIRKVHWDLPTSGLDQCPSNSELAGALVLRLAALSSDHGTAHMITIDMRKLQAHYLLPLLRHAPSIVSHITSIRWGCGDGSTQWETRASQALAVKLSSIKVLTLAQWDQGPHQFVPTLPFQLIGGLFHSTSITTLKLENLVFTNGSQFVYFVHAFTNLNNFSHENIKWEEDTADVLSRGSPQAPPLQAIALASSQPTVSAGVVQWLLSQPVSPRLATIEASGIVPSEMNDLIQRCAPSILNLAFNGEHFITVH
jgi:hypothetical protein